MIRKHSQDSMNPKAKTMFLSMYNILNEKIKDPILAWDYLIEFLATNNSAKLITKIKHNFEWLTKDNNLLSDLMTLYDPSLVEGDYHDYLGDLYQEIVAPKLKSKNHPMLSENKAIKIAETQIGNTNKAKAILDPSVGTGRLLMAAYKIAPNAKLFGADYDIRKLRIAYTNLASHNIPAYLLHANPKKHEIDISKYNGRYNWEHANQWHETKDQLRPTYFENHYSAKQNSHLYTGGIR